VAGISSLPSLLADAWRKAFVMACASAGMGENQNVVIERRYVRRTEAAQVAVEEPVRLNVDVIVVSSTLTVPRRAPMGPIVVTVLQLPATGLVPSAPGRQRHDLSRSARSWRASR
jgi:hypothetical protein